VCYRTGEPGGDELHVVAESVEVQPEVMDVFRDPGRVRVVGGRDEADPESLLSR